MTYLTGLDHVDEQLIADLLSENAHLREQNRILRDALNTGQGRPGLPLETKCPYCNARGRITATGESWMTQPWTEVYGD